MRCKLDERQVSVKTRSTIDELSRFSRVLGILQRHILEDKSARRGDRLLNGWVGVYLTVVRVHCFPQKVVVRDGVTSVYWVRLPKQSLTGCINKTRLVFLYFLFLKQ